ncbi:MAG TPA: AI-2E family transporter [Quisquiliibacterium sp.]|nr:AI-2E family transporter [Quisquiliibacterium sp.]
MPSSLSPSACESAAASQARPDAAGAAGEGDAQDAATGASASPGAPAAAVLPDSAGVQGTMGVRNASLFVLAVLACMAMLRWASPVFIPVLLGLLFSYALAPATDRLERRRVPRALAAAIVILAVFGAVSATVWSLADDAVDLVEALPQSAAKLRQALRPRPGEPEGSIEKVQKAAEQLERAAEETGAVKPSVPRGVTRVQIEKPRFNLMDYLWPGTVGLLGLGGQAVVVSFIAYFLLAAGSEFRRKLVRIAGPTFQKRKITVKLLDEIAQQIQRYLLVQIYTSAAVGIATWLAFWWIGLEQAAVWGVIAAVFNLVPYIGAIALTGGATLAGFVQFGSLEMALAVGGAALVIQSLEGYVLTPWLTSRASRMSPVVIFVSVLAWGWMWGIPGTLLAIPIMMAVKAVCDHVEDLRPIGELLGD